MNFYRKFANFSHKKIHVNYCKSWHITILFQFVAVVSFLLIIVNNF